MGKGRPSKGPVTGLRDEVEVETVGMDNTSMARRSVTMSMAVMKVISFILD